MSGDVNNILVGQGCTASLSGLPSIPGATITYNWAVTGHTFQSWNGTSGTTPVKAVLGFGAPANPTAHWYWSDQQNTQNVTCTATVTPPSGQGSSFTITPVQSVLVNVPTADAKNFTGVGHIGLYHSGSSQLSMLADPTALMQNSNRNFGSTWETSVLLKTPFTGSPGKWGYAQIITPGEYLTTEDGILTPSPYTTGKEYLDGAFPYKVPKDPTDQPTHLTDSISRNIYNNGDSPALPLYDLYKEGTLTDYFGTYLMFLPPAAPSAAISNDVQWVPLQKSKWNTNLHAYRPDSGLWSDFSPTQSVGPVVLERDFAGFYNHPEWTQAIVK